MKKHMVGVTALFMFTAFITVTGCVLWNPGKTQTPASPSPVVTPVPFPDPMHNGWAHDTQHWINGSSKALPSYTMTYDVYNTIGTSHGNTVFTNGWMKSFPYDMMFTDSNTKYGVDDTAQVIYPYQINSYNDTYASITVQIPLHSGASNRTDFVMWYGKADYENHSEVIEPATPVSPAPNDDTWSLPDHNIVGYGASSMAGNGAVDDRNALYWFSIGNPDWTVLNGGVPGSTYAQLADDDWYNDLCGGYYPTYVINWLGNNELDGSMTNLTSECEPEISTIYGYEVANKSTPILLTQHCRTPPSWESDSPIYAEQKAENTWIANTAKDHGWVLVDEANIVSDPETSGDYGPLMYSFLNKDNTHLNNLGYKWVGTNITLGY